MFGSIFGGGGNNAPAQPTHTPTPAPAGQGNGGGTSRPAPAPANPGSNPAPARDPHSGQFAQPGAQPAPAQNEQPSGGQVLSLADLLSRSAPSGEGPSAERAAMDYANDFIGALVSSDNRSAEDQSGRPVQIDTNALHEAYQNVDLTSNLNLAGLLEGLQGDEGPQLLQQTLQQTQVNTIMAMAPLVNQLVAAAVERAQSAAVTQSDHNLRSSSIIQEFQSRYAYGGNPIVSQMLTGFAQTLAKNAPPGTTTSQIVDALDHVFRGLSTSTAAPRGNGMVPEQAQVDHSGLFR